MGSLFKSTYVVGNVVRTNIERYLINGEEFSWSQLGVDLLTIGLEVFAMKNAAKGLVEAENMQVCFVAGTLITTAEGYKAIEEIQAGDEVLAKDVETGEVAVKKVVRTFVNETDELVHVHVNGEEIIATPTHPFYVNQFGWTHAADLRAGDVLVLSNGEYVVVEAIQHEILESPVKVYNFEVEDYHTYFVGESGALVHNGCEESNFVLFNKTHGDAQPSPRGTGPNGGRLQSHHGLQRKWAMVNLSKYGYDPELAPTVTIETGANMPHTVITNAQNARRIARTKSGQGAWSTTLQQELQYIVDDFTSAGFSKETIKKFWNSNIVC